MENYTDISKISKIIEYYRKKGLLIIALNDSQGVNVSRNIFEKGFLEFLTDTLSFDDFTPEVINAFSLCMNKTEHIDYFFQNNLNVEEIKRSQVYSAVSAWKKGLSDFHCPQFFGNLAYLYKFVYKIKSEDKNLRLSSALMEASEPIVIYSSGANNLMRAVGSDPSNIKWQYKKRNTLPHYNYVLEKAQDPNILTDTILSVKKNFETILNINPNSDIYTIGAYIPKSLRKKEMNLFRDLAYSYNKSLKDLCDQYHITFIDTENIGKKYNNSESNFHVTTEGHNALASHILNYIYEKKILFPEKSIVTNKSDFDMKDGGPQGVINALSLDLQKTLEKAETLSGYPKQRELAIAEEHIREIKVFEKVLKYSK